MIFVSCLLTLSTEIANDKRSRYVTDCMVGVFVAIEADCPST